MRNAERAEVGGAPPGPLAPEEKDLIKRLTDFPLTVSEAAERRGPQLLPSYAIRLADDYHRFYHACRVLGDPAQAFRLGLCRASQQVIARMPRPRRSRRPRADVIRVEPGSHFNLVHESSRRARQLETHEPGSQARRTRFPKSCEPCPAAAVATKVQQD